MSESTEIEVFEAEDAEFTPVVHGTLFGTDDPVAVLERATSVATALMDMVKRHDKGKPKEKRLVSDIKGKEFPKVECWTMLGSMLGVFPVLEGEPELVEIAGVAGWKATVAAQDRSGAVVGRASALCMRSESTWRSRDDYALMSMAQTRATSKALSQPLRFVMVLAGLEGTPEAEMPADSASGRPQEAAGREADVRVDGREPAKSATSYGDWVARMVALEVPRAEEWGRSAAEAAGVKASLARLNRVMLWFSDREPASSLGFWSEAEIQEGFALGFDGVVVPNPSALPSDPPEVEEDPSVEFAPELPLVEEAS